MSNGCPCYVLNEPCIPQCTCVNGFMSGGCRRCASYGSLAQRRSAARRLAAAQAEIARLTVRTKTLEMLLADYTSWKPEKGVIPKVSMTHGTCCCCRECGQNHDDCVCTHNEIATALATIATDKGSSWIGDDEWSQWHGGAK